MTNMSDDGNATRIDNSDLFDSLEDMECDDQNTPSSAEHAKQGTNEKMEGDFTIINECGECIDDPAKNASDGTLALSSSNASLSSIKGKKTKSKGQAKRLKEKMIGFEEEISRLKEKECQLENTNSQLVAETQSLKEKEFQLQNRNSQLAEEIQRLQQTCHDLKTKNDRLAEEINNLSENNISLSAQVKQMETKVQCIPIMQKENETLTQKYSRAQEAQKELQDEVKGWENYVAQLNKKQDTDVKKLEKEIGEHRKNVAKLSDEKKALQMNLARKDEENKNHVASAKVAEKQFETARKNFEAEKSNLQKQVKTLQDEKFKSNKLANELQKSITQKERDIWQCQQHIQQMQTTISSQVTTIDSLEKDKKDLTLRLSKLAGANLTYNNPNIADLSDENRPTKLSEEFSELYDNEWTDAFEVIANENEKEKTEFMLNILKHVSQLCHDTSKNHMDAIMRSLSTLVIRDLWAEEEEAVEEVIRTVSAKQVVETNKDKMDQQGERDLLGQNDERNKTNQPGTDAEDNDKGCNQKLSETSGTSAVNSGEHTGDQTGLLQKEKQGEPVSCDILSQNKEEDKTEQHGTNVYGNQPSYDSNGTKVDNTGDQAEDEILGVKTEKEAVGENTPADFDATENSDGDINKHQKHHQEAPDALHAIANQSRTNAEEPGEIGSQTSLRSNATGQIEYGLDRESSHPQSDKPGADMHPNGDNSVDNELNTPPDAYEDKSKDYQKTESTKRCSRKTQTYFKTLSTNFEQLANEQKKTILDIRKFFENQLSKDFYKIGKDIVLKEMGIDEQANECIDKYIEKCMTVCWSMCRHQPPVHIHFPETKPDLPYDTNTYKPYTKTGKHLDFVVWPALYLHENGPMLSKGVAQGRK